MIPWTLNMMSPAGSSVFRIKVTVFTKDKGNSAWTSKSPQSTLQLSQSSNCYHPSVPLHMFLPRLPTSVFPDHGLLIFLYRLGPAPVSVPWQASVVTPLWFLNLLPATDTGKSLTSQFPREHATIGRFCAVDLLEDWTKINLNSDSKSLLHIYMHIYPFYVSSSVTSGQ